MSIVLKYTVCASSFPSHLTWVIYYSSRVLHTNQCLFKLLFTSTITSKGKGDGRQIGVGRVKMYGKTSSDTKLSHLNLDKLPCGAVRGYQLTYEGVHLTGTHTHDMKINAEM